MFSQFSTIGNFLFQIRFPNCHRQHRRYIIIIHWKEIIIRQQQKDVIGYIRGSNRPLRQEVAEEKTEEKSRILQI